ncbi:MAG TPA: FHA domain-containing protein [Vicinamibacteria bacterium]|nr:FHA domain-containing protein [Vicinamibacteria bacterium]
MIVVCPSCQSRYKFDESKLGDRPKVKTRCSKCGGTIEIENPLLGSSTIAPEEPEPQPPPTPPAPPAPPTEHQRTQRTPVQPGQPEAGSATISGGDAQRMGLLQLPKDKRFSLAVIQGAATGQIFPISKTRTLIGRSGADINLDDPEASRQHAALEIVGDVAVLRDLGSTNGTWIELDRIEQHQLANQQEFRIGSHVLMFIVTEVE